MKDKLELRLKLLEIMKDKMSTREQQQRAEKHYLELGTASCDYETIRRFTLYRR